MTSLRRVRFRGWLVVVLASLTVCLGLPSRAHAADDKAPAAAAPPTPPATAADESNAAPPPSAAPAAAPAQVPQLQLQDEGPSAGRPDLSSDGRSSSSSPSSQDLVDDRPFWKSWIFWAVTGALLVGGIGLTAYTASQTNSSLAVCPPEVQVSLGCYGAGRGQ